MAEIRVTAEAIRRQLGHLLSQVQWKGDTVILQRYRKDAAVIISMEEYQRLKARDVARAAEVPTSPPWESANE